jgi:hypothetical protein
MAMRRAPIVMRARNAAECPWNEGHRVDLTDNRAAHRNNPRTASRNFRACTGVFEPRSRPAMMTDVVIIANGCLPAVSKICSAISVAGDMRWKTNGSCRSALTIRMWCSLSQQHSSRNRRRAFTSTHGLWRESGTLQAEHCRLRAGPQTLECAPVHSLWPCGEELQQVRTAA